MVPNPQVFLTSKFRVVNLKITFEQLLQIDFQIGPRFT